MARTGYLEYGVKFSLQFDSIIRGHHVSKQFWKPSKGEKLECRQDLSDDALVYDADSIGVYRNNVVVGHIPIELSSLINHFLKSNDQVCLSAIPTGKRKFEHGLVVPCTYSATWISSLWCIKRKFQILKRELENIKNKNNLEIVIKDIICKRNC